MIWLISCDGQRCHSVHGFLVFSPRPSPSLRASPDSPPIVCASVVGGLSLRWRRQRRCDERRRQLPYEDERTHSCHVRRGVTPDGNVSTINYGGAMMTLKPDLDQVAALLTEIREALDEIVRILKVHEAAHLHRAEEDAHLLAVVFRKHGKHLWDMTLQQRRIAIAGLDADQRYQRGRHALTNGASQRCSAGETNNGG